LLAYVSFIKIVVNFYNSGLYDLISIFMIDIDISDKKKYVAFNILNKGRTNFILLIIYFKELLIFITLLYIREILMISKVCSIKNSNWYW